MEIRLIVAGIYIAFLSLIGHERLVELGDAAPFRLIAGMVAESAQNSVFALSFNVRGKAILKSPCCKRLW